MPEASRLSQSSGVQTVSVLIPENLPGAYDYALAPSLSVKTGDIVRVPLGPRKVLGVVLGPGQADLPKVKLRHVIEKLDAPPISKTLLKFVEWVADYTLSRPGHILALALKPAFVDTQEKLSLVYRLNAQGVARITPQRKRVIEIASDKKARTQGELADAAQVSEAVVRGLIQAGVLQGEIAKEKDVDAKPDGFKRGPALSPEQTAAARHLSASVSKHQFETWLLDGVPGSGKTETYFEAVAQALKNGRQALVLMPEIALTVQFIERFKKRFGVPPLVWHSGMSAVSRRRGWRAIASGDASLVIGARSALFLPFAELGLIIVDEEHDPAYKQEEGVIYHARDMAVVRGQIEKIPVILSSATPSLESHVNAERGRYHRLVLPKRHGAAIMPVLEAVDMRTGSRPQAMKLAKGHFLSPPLVEAIAGNLEAQAQTLLFLNRRGYAPLTLCRHCGHRFSCPNCSAWLVEHRAHADLQCHHCGHRVLLPQICPACEKPDTLVPCGPGVERIAEEVGKIFPKARVAVMSSDNLPNAEAAQSLYDDIASRRVDIIIGTQLAAKGHHFPHLTLVGVVDADLGLTGGDLRAAERSFQLLYQVAGRAGRAETSGRVLIQTYMPEHPVMGALVAGNRDEFVAAEAAEREAAAMPPFGRLVGIILSSPKRAVLEEVGAKLARLAPQKGGVRVLGPAPAPIAFLRGRHRLRLLVKAGRMINVQSYMRQWLGGLKLPGSVRLSVDIDPISFF